MSILSKLLWINIFVGFCCFDLWWITGWIRISMEVDLRTFCYWEKFWSVFSFFSFFLFFFFLFFLNYAQRGESVALCRMLSLRSEGKKLWSASCMHRFTPCLQPPLLPLTSSYFLPPLSSSPVSFLCTLWTILGLFIIRAMLMTISWEMVVQRGVVEFLMLGDGKPRQWMVCRHTCFCHLHLIRVQPLL